MPYLIALIVIIVAAIGFSFLQNKDAATEITLDQTIDAPNPEADNGVVGTDSATPSESTEAPLPTETMDYTDGTYKSQVTYFTPNRDEYLLDVALTIKSDIITAANVTYSQGAEKDPNAQRFEGAYREVVVGQDLDSLNLSRVGGASLTTGAFNRALDEIKAEADA